ncbi:MAG: hypothetical protein MRY72_02725 [Aquisalinus sp.]|nr:hypothetical protein [Aquisalinus sp.]
MNDKRADDSLKAAQAALKAQKRQARQAEEVAEHEQATTDAADFLNKIWGGFSILEKTGAGLKDVWNSWFKHVAVLLNPLFRRLARLYSWIYRKVAYVKGEAGEKVHDTRRAGIAILLLVALTVFGPILLVRNIIPGTMNTIYDAVMLTLTKEDQLYLSRMDIIDADRDLYQVMGCRDIKGCDGGDNTTYFRLRPNIILGAKYWFTRFEPYDPAEIGGAMVSELNDCKIQYYGRRVKAFGWYPYIISASCVPVGQLPS